MPKGLGLAEERVASDEAVVRGEFIAFMKAVSLERHPTGVVRRFNQGRETGCVDAEFTVLDSLPPELHVGLFAEPRTYPAVIRFANASSQDDRDRDVRGMAIQVRQVSGDNLTPGAATQDFVLNSHPVMVAPGSKDFLALLQALEAGGFQRARYFLSHPKSAFIGVAARQNPTSHLDIPYWSTTPYLFGAGRAVKYIARPCSSFKSTLPRPLTDNYLLDALKRHLEQADGCFDFMVQFQTDARRMPIEDASVEWKEHDSPYRAVARIRIPRQSVDATGREPRGETMAFNPWHCLAEHRPLGDFNRARREIYEEMARFREERGRGATTVTTV
jgi:hypothetical protein